MSHRPDTSPMRVAIVTAGAAGMYCGSCMRDNTLAKALCRLGADARLIPTYTPIRTDEEDVSVDQVFFGGINIFLQEKIPLFRSLPKMIDGFLDRPGLIRWATSKATSTDAKKLGGLTVSMLQGSAGHQSKEVRRLCEWMTDSFRPNVVNFSNVLIAGCIPDLRQHLPDTPMLVTLQGDDIFLDELTPEYHKLAIAEIQKLDPQIEGYITFSTFYADYMSHYLGIDRSKFVIVPLGIELEDFVVEPTATAPRRPHEVIIGYLARIAPEKGFHLLVDAFIQLHQRHRLESVRLAAAGWLGDHRKDYFHTQVSKLAAAGLSEHFVYEGELDRKQKAAFMRSINIMSVPTTFLEPKGIYVLESLACGVPVVQPNHGAFPELLASTEGGILCEPNSADALANRLAELIGNKEHQEKLGRSGQQNVIAKHSANVMARQSMEVFRQFIDSSRKR